MKAYKTELAPNQWQASKLQEYADVRKFVYNLGRLEWDRQYQLGNKPSEYGLRKLFNAVKRERMAEYNSWPGVTGVPYSVTEGAFADLGDAYKNFYRRVKRGEKPGFPKAALDANRFHMRGVKVKIDRVRISGIGWIRLKERNYLPVDGEYGIYATVTKRAGRWFISILEKSEEELLSGSGVIGVDFGIKNLAVCSNGKVFENPKALSKAMAKVSRLNRELSRRNKGSANWYKTKKKLQVAYYKLSNVRKHCLHQVSSYLVKNAGTIVIEDLHVKGMVKNRHLAKAVSDAGMSELRRQIEYKAEKSGVEVIIADRWYPSSKTCSQCGYKKENLKLSDRVYKCPECGLVIDRDLNAACNLAALGTAKHAGIACGVEV